MYAMISHSILLRFAVIKFICSCKRLSMFCLFCLFFYSCCLFVRCLFLLFIFVVFLVFHVVSCVLLQKCICLNVFFFLRHGSISLFLIYECNCPFVIALPSMKDSDCIRFLKLKTQKQLC